MITIRPAKFKERDIIVDFQKKMAWETEDLKLNEDLLRKGVEAVFEDFNKGIYYVAEEEGVVMACLLTTYEWSEWRNGTVVWIQSVYVDETHRNRGVFKQLYNFIKEMVEKDDGLKGIRLYVEKANLNAQKVYQSIGMNGEHYSFFEWMKSY